MISLLAVIFSCMKRKLDKQFLWRQYTVIYFKFIKKQETGNVFPHRNGVISKVWLKPKVQTNKFYQFYFTERQSSYIITCKNFKFLKASVKYYTQFPYTAGSKARKELTQLLSLKETYNGELLYRASILQVYALKMLWLLTV